MPPKKKEKEKKEKVRLPRSALKRRDDALRCAALRRGRGTAPAGDTRVCESTPAHAYGCLATAWSVWRPRPPAWGAERKEREGS